MITSSDKRVLHSERDMDPAPKPVSLVDYPGHQRLRGCVPPGAGLGRSPFTRPIPSCRRPLRSGLTNVLKDAGGVILTLDSSSPGLRDTAESVPAAACTRVPPPHHRAAAARLVYDIFTDQAFATAQPPVLFACNKADLPGATSPADIRAALEKELCGACLPPCAAPAGG